MKKIICAIMVLILMLFPLSYSASAAEPDTPPEGPGGEDIIEHYKNVIFFMNPTETTHEVWECEYLINTETGMIIGPTNSHYLYTSVHHFIHVFNSIPDPQGDETENYAYSEVCRECGYTRNVTVYGN